MRLAGGRAVGALLSARRPFVGDGGAGARARPGVYRLSLFWQSADGLLAGDAGVCGESQARESLDAGVGTRRHLSRPAHDDSAARSSRVSLFIARDGHLDGQPGMEHRHHLYPPAAWHQLMPDPTIADAICDRLIHTSTVWTLKGDSQRKQNQTDK